MKILARLFKKNKKKYQQQMIDLTFRHLNPEALSNLIVDLETTVKRTDCTNNKDKCEMLKAVLNMAIKEENKRIDTYIEQWSESVTNINTQK